MMVAWTIGALLSFAIGSMAYVYRFRGVTRYATLSEYLRKSWPIFAPLNCLLYMFTERRASKPIMRGEDFPELARIREHWTTIRDEAVALYKTGSFEAAKAAGSVGSYDVGFRTFYKYGWSKYYLRWYGYSHASALASCPQTVKLLASIPAVNGAMFSVLPPGGKLTRHADPMACSLRYHLGLATPNHDACYINIDGQNHSWRDGEVLIFDETYLHYAHNDAQDYRIILMCDVRRPTNLLGSLINLAYYQIMKLTVVPNDERDRRGFANRVMGSVAPLVARGQELKRSNRSLYKLIKYSINALLALILLGVLAGLFSAVRALVMSVT